MTRRAVLFICMGNICRSPTAEGVFRKLLRERGLEHLVEVDSAGTHDYHVGARPDRRAIAAAARRGVDLSSLCARQVEEADYERFDLLLVMDSHNHEWLLQRCPRPHQAKLRLFMDYAPQTGRTAVPDPYYGGTNAFEEVLDLVEQAAEGLLAELTKDNSEWGQTPSRR